MKVVKTLTVDLYEPSKEEEVLYRIGKDWPEGGVSEFYYDRTTKFKVYLNIYNKLIAGIPYIKRGDKSDHTTIYIKNGKMELKDEFYFYTFDYIEAEEKVLEGKKKRIEDRKVNDELKHQEMYEEIKAKYADADWFNK